MDLETLFVKQCPPDKIYQERLQQEFTLIEKFKFSRVFLQVQKIVSILREKKISHIIRGSAGSSLVCFLLGITQIDPIRYNLQLARFMNESRTDLPDIDIDVPYNRREELFKAISKEWPKKVAHISNYVTYGEKVAIREVAKEFVKDSQQLSALRRKHFRLEKIVPQESTRSTILSKANEKIGTLKNYSLHCGGIVIFEEKESVPKEFILDTRDDGKIQLSLNKDDTEEKGFIKIDILSNRGLAVLIEAEHTNPRQLLEYPTNDSKITELFTKGKTFGLTFSESRGCRRVLMKIRPRNMEDVAIALAVIRPAAAGGGRKCSFLERWKHGTEIEENPNLRPIVFDDDAILRIQSLLDCDESTADRWRKIFAKEKKEEIRKFYLKMSLKGHSREICQTTIDDLEMLSYYSFCKSHAISYAQLVWALAWHKVYNPHRFWVAVLNHNHSEYRKWVLWREAFLSGLSLTRESGPWTLGIRNGKPAILGSSKVEQSLLFQPKNQNISDFKQFGYWLSNSFFDTCGLWISPQQKIDSMLSGKKTVKFRGLIACCRIYKRDTLLTFITIGTDNGIFYDLTIEGSRGDLFAYAVVEGTGELNQEEQILVEKIRGVSLKTIKDEL
jgi:error-prone DNA polymerase